MSSSFQTKSPVRRHPFSISSCSFAVWFNSFLIHFFFTTFAGLVLPLVHFFLNEYFCLTMLLQCQEKGLVISNKQTHTQWHSTCRNTFCQKISCEISCESKSQQTWFSLHHKQSLQWPVIQLESCRLYRLNETYVCTFYTSPKGSDQCQNTQTNDWQCLLTGTLTKYQLWH